MHTASPDYALQRFRDDPQHLSDVVRFDQPRRIYDRLRDRPWRVPFTYTLQAVKA